MEDKVGNVAAATTVDGINFAAAADMTIRGEGGSSPSLVRHHSDVGTSQQGSEPHSSELDHRLPLHSTNHHHSLKDIHHNAHTATASINSWYPPQEYMNVNNRLFQSNHESFLEKMARQECRNLPCKEHQSLNGVHQSDLNNDIHASNQNNDAENDEDGRNEERRRFMLLDFESDNDDSDSEEYSSTEDEGEEEEEQHLREEGNVSDEIIDEEEDGDNDHQDLNDEPANQLVVGDERVNEGDVNNSNRQVENSIDLRERANSFSVLDLLSTFTSSTIAYIPTMEKNPSSNLNHQRITSLLLSLANSEEQPLIRADIPWSVIISFGSLFMHPSQHQNLSSSVLKSSFLEASAPAHLQPKPCHLQTLYHQQRDPNGARLIQGVLRMDPPLDAVKVLLDAFPLSCLDMEGFFTACQFAHPNTSRRTRECRHEIDIGYSSAKESHDNTSFLGKSDIAADKDDDYEHETDDVGEVVKLVMKRTISARRLNSIEWGMVAFLGDARISPSHAKLLLRHAPEALIDSKHGAFGVSPLDRMASGFFIHGETNAWVEKLRLALRVAAFVWLRQKQLEGEEGDRSSSSTKILLPKGFFCSDCRLLRRRESSFDTKGSNSAQSFYPYHELIRLIISPNFRGNKFGKRGFLKTLQACEQSDPDAFLRPDNEGNLPIHIALRSECETVLGVKDERRLIKYLLDLDQNTALCPEGSSGCGRRLPLRMSVENAWPVYDLIIMSALACCEGTLNDLAVTNDCKRDSQKYKHESESEHCCKDYIVANMVLDRPLLHDALNGPYHPRFGIHGARQLVKNIISKITHYHYQQQNRGSAGKSHHNLTNFADANGRTALHIALESKWPVYDLIVQANPNFCLETRDPTRHGFFPFQIAACEFTAGCLNEGGKVKKERQAQLVLDGSAEASELSSGATGAQLVLYGSAKASGLSSGAAGDQKEVALVEMSMLFELIRESPLCVTWRMSDENQSEVREQTNSVDGSSSGDYSSRRSKKRRRPSSPANMT
mmetsp:Transcript_5001/g.11431  ORF Transcript_5001/g.11431 Transcript_5001/m.11431 type:complete len:1005 (-) Transcript_5001:849-3863(-)